MVFDVENITGRLGAGERTPLYVHFRFALRNNLANLLDLLKPKSIISISLCVLSILSTNWKPERFSSEVMDMWRLQRSCNLLARLVTLAFQALG
jgi:hypothetical protein